MKTKIGILAALLMCALGQVSAAEKVTYYHLDALGSPIAATDANGNLAWKEAYKPYGERIRKEDGGSNSTWYTGKQEDADNGLTYFGARWYDPAIGRFMGVDNASVDPEDYRTFNRYAYAANNPYKYVDPDGNLFFIPILVFLAKEIASSVVEHYTGFPTGVKGLVTKGLKALVKKEAAKVISKGAGKAASKSDNIIHVTRDGVALPPGAKYKIPDNYVQNPHRSGNYGEIVDGKFKERLRIDPPTPPGKKGPNYSHYHKNGKGTHYSPRAGDKDPGF